MIIKPGAIIAGLHPVMRSVLREADKIWKAHGEELVVTAGLDGTHSAASWHYYGLALDFRTKYFLQPQVRSVGADLKMALPDTISLSTAPTFMPKLATNS